MNTQNYNVFNFQDPATPVAEGIIDLHNYIIFYLIIVLVFVIAILIDLFIQNYEVYKSNFSGFKNFFVSIMSSRPTNFWAWRRAMLQLNRVNHATNLEIAWTVLPSFVLILIAIPSLSLLYSMDEMLYPELTFKAVGYQWYWSYEIGNCVSDEFLFDFIVRSSFILPNGFSQLVYTSFDSYMQSVDWSSFGHRLLSVDVVLALPVRQHIRVVVTGADVLHSWAVPSFGIKIDAVPGRLNQGAIYLKRSGIFYGQCSELCGVNHGFMPIVVHAMDFVEVQNWAFERSGLFSNILKLQKLFYTYTSKDMSTFIVFNSLLDTVFLNVIIFGIAFFSAMLHSSNFIRLLVNIELMILVSNLNFIIFSFILDDLIGQIFVIFVLAVVAAESALGLAIFILYYRIYKTISIYSLVKSIK